MISIIKLEVNKERFRSPHKHVLYYSIKTHLNAIAHIIYLNNGEKTVCQIRRDDYKG